MAIKAKLSKKRQEELDQFRKEWFNDTEEKNVKRATGRSIIDVWKADAKSYKRLKK